MNIVDVTQKLSVMPQPLISDFPELKQRGFATIINNRPEGEDAAQPSSVAEKRAAQAVGLYYFHIPVTGPGMTEADARLFQHAIEASPGAVLAHCRSGARSFLLWIMAGNLENKTDDEVLELAERLRLDRNSVAARLTARGLRSAGGNK